MSGSGGEGLCWTLRVDGPADGPANMASDHAMARSLPEGEAVLRLYGWSGPTLSLGRNEPARARYDRAAAARRGVSFVRRPTGGRAVLHHREVTYAVAAPLRAFGGLRAAYAAINGALVRGLSHLGAPVALAGDGAPGGKLPPGAGACFREPAEGEVVAGGAKLVGSAQARIGDALLQHGSVLLADDQGLVEAVRSRAPGAPNSSREKRVAGSAPGAASATRPRVATLRTLLGRSPPVDEVVEAVVEGFQAAMRGRWRTADAPLALPPALLARYRSAEWTWRR